MFNNNKPNREFQSGLRTEDRRRLRQDESLKLRKADRENRLQKKRQALTNRTRSFNTNNTDTNNKNLQKQMLQQLPQFVKGCFSNNAATQFECTQRIRKLLSIERAPPIRAVIATGVATRLVQFLKLSDFPRLQFEAAWALTNIASGTAENTAVVIRYGAIPIFVSLVSSSCSLQVREQAIWALGNISGDSPECRNLVLANGGLTALLSLLQNVFGNVDKQTTQSREVLTLLRNATWTLSNFCRGKPSPSYKYTADAISALSVLLRECSDIETLSDCCWALSYLSDVDESVSQSQVVRAIIDSGCLARLLLLLESTSPQASHVIHPSLRTIGNIVTGCDADTQCVVNLGVLGKLHNLLSSRNGSGVQRGDAIKREACWTISNITAGSQQQIESVISCNLVPALINVLATERFTVSKEALWAISNLTSGGSDKQIQFLVNQGVVEPLCNHFNPNRVSPGHVESQKCLLVALEGLDNILGVGKRINCLNAWCRLVEEANGVDYLERIQAVQTMPEHLYDRAAEIIKKYFGGNDGGDPMQMNQTQMNQTQTDTTQMNQGQPNNNNLFNF